MQFTSLSYVYIPSGTWEAKASSQLCRWKKCYWNVEIPRVSDNLLSVLMSVCTVCKCVSTNMDTGSCVEATGQLSLSLIHNKPSPQHHGLNVSSDYCGKVCWNLKNYHYKTRHWSANPWPNNFGWDQHPVIKIHPCAILQSTSNGKANKAPHGQKQYHAIRIWSCARKGKQNGRQLC